MGFAILQFVSNPPVGWWPLCFIAYGLLLLFVRTKPLFSVFCISLFAGVLTYSLLFSWLHVLSRFNAAIYLGIPALGLFQGLFLAVSCLGFEFFRRRIRGIFGFCVGCSWVLLVEWCRANGPLGAPYAQLGHPLIEAFGLRQWAAVGGVMLLSASVLAFNVGISELVRRRLEKHLEPKQEKLILLGLGLPVLLAWGLGGYWESLIGNRETTPVRVAILQSNISQDKKFASYASEDAIERERLQRELIETVFMQLEKLEESGMESDLILTPESGFTVDDFDRNAEVVFRLQMSADELQAPIVVGATDLAFRREDGSLTDNLEEARILTSPSGVRYYDYEVGNALFLFKPGGKPELPLAADYLKIHLMPFGETVPFFHIIPGFVENLVQVGMMLPGDDKQKALAISLQKSPIEELKLGATICFEDMFPGLYRKYNQERAHLFINATNNAWFDPSWGSEYHFAYSRFRSIEYQTPAIRCTNTGISALVLPTGEVAERLPTLQELVRVVEVPVPVNPIVTIYGRLGEWVLWLCLGIFVAGTIITFQSRSKSTPDAKRHATPSSN